MSVNRTRKEASKRLALAVQARYRNLIEAGADENALAVATADLAMVMYENVEFIINVLRAFGGLEARFEAMTKKVEDVAPPPKLPDISALTAPPPAVPDKCTCPPIEPGIIGPKHMASCPQFQPVVIGVDLASGPDETVRATIGGDGKISNVRKA